MEVHQLLQKLQTAASKAAERASDCCEAEATPEAATSAAKFGQAALSLTQATVTLQAGSNGRR